LFTTGGTGAGLRAGPFAVGRPASGRANDCRVWKVGRASRSAAATFRSRTRPSSNRSSGWTVRSELTGFTLTPRPKFTGGRLIATGSNPPFTGPPCRANAAGGTGSDPFNRPAYSPDRPGYHPGLPRFAHR
jgi:hypothetical protein